ncbi:PAS domain S-box protein [Argonema galeatum]|uniref:PAS domain S-box protein n=1 Tax=Argonema galeatum TaxID=2942762 RepID=UPI002011CF2B|nr:PAS domain S-box protein [Argonema galeatum A003/A1]
MNQDITEQQLVEKAFWENQRFIQQIAEATPAILYIYDLHEQRNIYANRQTNEILGYSPEEIQEMGSAFSQNLIHPDDWVKFSEKVKNWDISKDGEVIETEYRMKHKNGEWRWFSSRDTVFASFADGLPKQILGTAIDITSSKQAIEKLRQSEELYRITLTNISDAVFITDRTGGFTFICPNVNIIFGYSYEEVEKFGYISHLLGEDLFDYKELESCGEIHNIEREITNKTGQKHTLLINVKRVSINSGTVLYACRDITDRKQSEVALHASSQLLEAVFESAIDAILIADDNGEYLAANPAASEIFGLPSEEIIGKSIGEFLESGINFRKAWQSFTEKGRKRGEFRIRRRDDTMRDIEYSAIANFLPHRHLSVIRDITSSKQTEAQLSQYRDRLEELVELRTSELRSANEQLRQEISDRKRTEEALRDSEERFRAIFEQAAVGIVTTTANGQYISFNQKFCEIVGYTHEELQTRTFWEITHPDDMAENMAYRQQLVAGKIPNFSIEKRYIRKDGDVVWVCLTVSLVLSYAGKMKYFIAVVQDISERQAALRDRKQAEEELKQQKELLQKIFDHIPVMVDLFDIDGKIKMVNREWEKVLGWSLLELQNFDVMSEFYPDPEYRQEVLNFIASADHQWGDFKTRIRSGRILDTSWANVLLSDGTNIGIGQDISDRKRAEAALRESEERFRKIFAQAPIGIALSTADGQLFQVNQTFCQMLGYTESEMKALNLRDISYPADREKELPYIEECRKGKITSYQLEKCYIKKSGDLVLTNLIGGLIRDRDKNIVYALSMIEDITERKQIERMKDEFISIVSHELRTPLTSLLGALGLLSTGRLGAMNEQGQRLLEFAMEDTDRLVLLVNDILDMERLKLGKMTLNEQICDAADLMGRVINLMQPLAQKAEVTLSVIADSVKVWADSDRIIQVLTNLLSNAIKFSPPASTVFLSAHLRENRILFEVKDTGRGIPTEHLQKIFEPFQQVDASDSRQKGGTGLGLTICRSIVEQHGGRIWVESTLEGGSTFCFDLPMQP